MEALQESGKGTLVTFQHLLETYREVATSQRDKGDRFERLMQAYLLTDPKYTAELEKVWLWSEFVGREDLGGTDTGIDLVARTHDGDYWAIQCKCFQEDAHIDKKAVDTFLATSSKTFADENGARVRFAHRLWISTTNNWGGNANKAIENQDPPVSRINLFDLAEAPVDWEALDDGIHGEKARTPKKTLFPHQKQALEAAHEFYQTADRGKLIMACGTGKTFTALRIAERETDGSGLVLFLVPSIALLGQTLREWSADAIEPINPICICSDPKVSRSRTKNEDADFFSVVDLAMPASTDPEAILHQFRHYENNGSTGMTVVFSTYHSIEVIARAQERLMEEGFPPFDLIVCDEAHRTTGVTLAGEDESAFVKVHDDDFLQARKRLYMTATPRLYSDDAQSRAAEADAVLCSMDDPRLYGEEIYRIGFGEAVEKDLLTDYKVLILTLNDKDVPPAVQQMLSDGRSEIDTDDLSKLIGTINAISKQFIGDGGQTREADPEPMQKGVAFCPSIKASKKITATYNDVSQVYLDSLPPEAQRDMMTVAARHMDGTMSAPVRDEMLGWLQYEDDLEECRVITNVRVLSEGVDVPTLDSVLFLSARNSQVDVVQSVGRVMRKAPGKKYGYIIIPVVVPADVSAEEALSDNKRFAVVWTVLNALRAHDDRFNATVNKIELNKQKPNNILIGRPEVSFDGADGAPRVHDPEAAYETTSEISEQLALRFEQLQSVIFARMVKKVGDRRYWEEWAKDIAVLAQRQIERIQALIDTRQNQREAFDEFLEGLRKNINPSIEEEDAVEMLAQHIITRPVFEALFEGYSFIQNNAVSSAMQGMLDHLEGQSVAEESHKLQRFYDSVRKRAEGIDNAEGKQRIIIELYDKFFKNAFPRMVERLGIVYTPVEVVDFIIHSLDHVLQSEFGRRLTDENVHILDPFVGTGTFITRLLQSGLIDTADLERKYRHELHANEIVLLAYYIAAVNIENAYHDATPSPDDGLGKAEYTPFEGIVLTDTFQLGETDANERLFSEMFPRNSERVARQKAAPIRVIMGNPPYSVGQKSANDNAQNQEYERLDARIGATYAAASTATNKNALYDSYIKAFRWSTDRLDPEHGGVIGFVTNGSWLDGNSTAGFRKVVEKEFSSIWVFNLRGNQRTSGELSRKEGGKIFGSGSRAPISITLLVKGPEAKNDPALTEGPERSRREAEGKATIHYHDIGDYHSREDKLRIIRDFQSVANPDMAWRTIKPNKHGDWLKQRNEAFQDFIPLGDKKDKKNKATYFVPVYGRGLATTRDAWAYNSNRETLVDKVSSSIDFYQSQLREFQKAQELDAKLEAEDFVKYDSKRFHWSAGPLGWLESGRAIVFNDSNVVNAVYRPFFKQKCYFHRSLNERVYQLPKLFPAPALENRVICVAAPGGKKRFSVIMADCIPDLHLNGDSQCFPLYYYEEGGQDDQDLFQAADGEAGFVRKDGVSDFILKRAREQYGATNIGKEDIFYYVYGFLHSPEYRTAFANDLKKMLPRLPLVEDVKDFWAFSKAGRKLAELHIGYEDVPPHPDVVVTGEESGNFRVEKMRFAKKDGVVKGKKKKVADKSTILYNSGITLTNIPEKAYVYVVNGKSAIEWIMDRYRVKTDKKSGITNDPNDWAEEVGNPRYILDLLLSVINVSVQTVDIVAGLPKLSFDTD